MRGGTWLEQQRSAFRGSEAVRAGVLTAEQLRGPAVQRLFRDVYAPAGVPLTHELRCEGAALVMPGRAVITGRSAATLRRAALAYPDDPVEILVPRRSGNRQQRGLQLRYIDVGAGEYQPWHCIGLASPMRMALDLILRRDLPDAVADLDMVLRAGQVELDAVRDLVSQRDDRGIVRARRAVAFADARAESRPESRMRVWLAVNGLHPEPQYWIHDDRGRLARADLAFPEHRLAVEYDGAWRSEPWALNRDRDRLNRVHAAGWDVVFVTAEILRDPARMVALVRAALARTR
jgi:hypothetical protein